MFYYPFDAMKPIPYWTIYFLSFCVGNLEALIFVFTDYLYISILSLTSMEFDILSEMISEINFENNEDAIKELKKFVKIHQQLIEVSEKLEKIFSLILFLEVYAFIASLCFFAFLIVVITWNIQ